MRCLNRSFILVAMLYAAGLKGYAQHSTGGNKVLPEICLSETERAIFHQVNEYRRQKGLPGVKLSLSLTYVAQVHVWGLAEHNPLSRRCNLHSWSDKGPWTGCCYTDDQDEAACMWEKPRELTNYSSEGYEIAYWTDEVLDAGPFAEKALRAWKRSAPHNRVIINSGEWRKIDWNAMGVGYYKGYAVVWFGAVTDTQTGEIHYCDN
jgi:uncharacterized protein YkwD